MDIFAFLSGMEALEFKQVSNFSLCLTIVTWAISNANSVENKRVVANADCKKSE